MGESRWVRVAGSGYGAMVVSGFSAGIGNVVVRQRILMKQAIGALPMLAA